MFLLTSLGLPDPAEVISKAVAYIDPDIKTFVMSLAAITAFKLLIFGGRK